MKKLLTIILIFFPVVLFSQEITEGNYLKVDKEIWDTYEQECNKILVLKKKHPEKRDSLNAIFDQLLEIANKKNCDAAIKYSSVPSGLKRLFMVRRNISKEMLKSILSTLPKEMQESDYGQSILIHINSKQIEEGDKYYDFAAVDSEGNKFQLSSIKSNYILLIYDGLSCMAQSGRNFLENLYLETQRDKFQIIVYCDCSSLEQLKEIKTKYSIDFPLVSDFLNDKSLIKIIYGVQAKPTCLLIDKTRNVVIKSLGLPEDELTKLKEENKFE